MWGDPEESVVRQSCVSVVVWGSGRDRWILRASIAGKEDLEWKNGNYIPGGATMTKKMTPPPTKSLASHYPLCLFFEGAQENLRRTNGRITEESPGLLPVKPSFSVIIIHTIICCKYMAEKAPHILAGHADGEDPPRLELNQQSVWAFPRLSECFFSYAHMFICVKKFSPSKKLKFPVFLNGG